MGAKKTGFEELGADLEHAVRDALPAARKIVAKGCLEIKRNAQKIIRENSHRNYLPHYPRAITYDTEIQGTVARGEVGALTERLQGGLSSVLENGTVNNAPIPHHNPALDAEEGVFYAYMDELGADLLEGVAAKGAPVVDPE